MYNEGAPDYIIDQGLYYPTGTSYGYICTGISCIIYVYMHDTLVLTPGLVGSIINGFRYLGLNDISFVFVGYEPTMDWEDQHRFSGVDSQDIHYTVSIFLLRQIFILYLV